MYSVCVYYWKSMLRRPVRLCEWELILYGWLVWIGNCFIQIDIGPISSDQRCAPLSRREWVPIRPPLWSAATAFWPLTLAFDLTPLVRVHARVKCSTQRQNSPCAISACARPRGIDRRTCGRRNDWLWSGCQSRLITESFVWCVCGRNNQRGVCTVHALQMEKLADIDWVYLGTDNLF